VNQKNQLPIPLVCAYSGKALEFSADPMRRLLCSVALAAFILVLPACAVKTAAHVPHPASAKVSRAHSAKPGKAAGEVRVSKKGALRTSKNLKVKTAATKSASRRAAKPGPARLVRVDLPAPLRGSHESLLRQNIIADQEGLERIADNNDLAEKIQNKELVALPAGSGLLVNPAMEPGRRYCRRWTAKFLTDIANVHQQRFHGPLEVTSAVRTVEMQRALLKVNGNAAPAEGDVASPHLTGAAVDIAKKGLSMSEIAWMRAWLLPLQQAGKIDVEEEFVQSCFHIAVYESYLPQAAKKTLPDPGNLNGRNLTAKALPATPIPSPKVAEVKVATVKVATRKAARKTPSRQARTSRHHHSDTTTLARRSGGVTYRRMG